MKDLFTMYGIEASINTATNGGTETYVPLKGFDNLTEALNEVVQQYFFLEDKGFATNHVTGMAPAFTLTGHRLLGDPAQEYIFGNKYGLGKDRESVFKIEHLNSEDATVAVTCPVTICNITEFSGASTDDSAISVEFRFNGKPAITTTPKS